MQLITHTDSIPTIPAPPARKKKPLETIIVVSILIASFVGLVIVAANTFPEIPLCPDSHSSNCYWDDADPENSMGLTFVTVDERVYRLKP